MIGLKGKMLKVIALESDIAFKRRCDLFFKQLNMFKKFKYSL